MHTIRFAILLMILLSACASPTPAPTLPPATAESFQLPPTWTPKPSQANYTATSISPPSPAATWTSEPTYTLLPTLTYLPDIDTSATPVLGYCYQAEDACEIAVRPSPRRGWCQLASADESCGLSYDYSLLYPQPWIVDTVGALRPNLIFVTGDGVSQVRLIQLIAGDMDLDTADQALLCNEAGDCLPLVSPDEEIVRRQTRAYAGRDYLFLTSSLADTFITRYFVFVNHPDVELRLYIIEIRLPAILLDSEEYNLLLEQAKGILGSIQPDTSVDVTPFAPTNTPTITDLPMPETPTP